MKRDKKITDILKPLHESDTQAYISNALQVADIAEWLLSSPAPTNPEGVGQQAAQAGMPASEGRLPVVRQTTFSISEEFLRRIYFSKQRHPARFVVIIDRKALTKTVQLWRFISQVYDEVWISDNHSKILLVDFPDGSKASVVTSQNLTRGNRAESAIVSSCPNIYGQLLNDFEDLKQNNSAPMHEIMPTSPAADLSPEDSGNAAGTKMTEEIERLAGYFVPVTDIAILLGLNPMELRERIADEETEESLAYRRGKAKAKVAIKANEMELARVGSPLAMQSVRENLLLMENDEQ